MHVQLDSIQTHDSNIEVGNLRRTLHLIYLNVRSVITFSQMNNHTRYELMLYVKFVEVTILSKKYLMSFKNYWWYKFSFRHHLLNCTAMPQYQKSKIFNNFTWYYHMNFEVECLMNIVSNIMPIDLWKILLSISWHMMSLQLLLHSSYHENLLGAEIFLILFIILSCSLYNLSINCKWVSHFHSSKPHSLHMLFLTGLWDSRTLSCSQA